MILDKVYWSERYKNEQTGWDIGYVSTPLKNYFDSLSDKSIKILIPGAGNAYEAEYLHHLGFEHVYVCDLAAEPLNNLKKRCPSLNKNYLIQEDFFKLNPAIYQFDLIIEQTFFCALNPALRQNYFEKMLELLTQGGKLVGLLFNCKFEQSPPFGGDELEYQLYIRELFKINTFKHCEDSIPARTGKELFMILEKA
ncbi:MAG: methyltransferase domain-containing protein [Sphingobacteriaceae bacterium]|nr:methyltransferase domain-containing protein [Sphingobacteriaceae bacterium]